LPFRDLAYASRTLRNSPVFTLTAVLTLALGVGASTAIFSVTNAVLLKPLPYRDADRLVYVAGEMRARNVKDWPFSNADFIDLRRGASQTFESFTTVFTLRMLLPKRDGTPEQIHVALVSPNIFQMMGGKIAQGRNFSDEDGRPQAAPDPTAGANIAQAPQNAPNVAILSHEYFERRYGGDTSVIGHPMVTTGGSGPQIVGVLAPGFELLFPPSAGIERLPEVWLASRLAYDNAQRNLVSLHVVGKLKPGVSVERAQAEVDAVAAEGRRTFPIHNSSGYAMLVEPLKKHLVAEVQPAILALMGAVIFLLLIACANVANLMLVRMSSRERELAVRVALGGSWGRLLRQTLTEALLLAATGSGLGIAVAWLGLHELLVIAPANLPRLDSIKLDPAVLLFALTAGLVATAIFGLAPAWRAARPDVMRILRGSSRTSGLGSGSSLRNTAVIAEVALSFVLLVGSGLMFRSFLALQDINPGYDSHNLLTFQILGTQTPNPQQRAATARSIQQKLSALPGVRSVTASSPFPLTGNFSPIRWGTAQALADPGKFQAVEPQMVLPGYFETLRTPLLAGRAFTDADNDHDRMGVIVDQVLANKAFPNTSAVGQRILIRLRTPEPEWVQIIGVVAHQRNTSLADPGREEIFFPDGFVGHGAANRWAVRTSGDPEKLAGAVRQAINGISPRFLITEMQPMSTLVERAQASTRFSLLLIALFAGIAALLAGVGLYGVLSTVVRQRTAEIGVRMALGAEPTGIFQLVVTHGLRLSAAGIVLGLAAGLGLTRWMKSMLVGVTATDPATFAAMAVLFLAVAAVASWLPARRASHLDPTTALRQE
jgi:predicted permease